MEEQEKPVNPGFRRGAIKSISLKNFLTFGSAPDGAAYFFPFEPRINIVCGPNGLGKSSLVAAINLCSGAKTVFLKRGKTLPEFIRHGEKDAMIEMTLHEPDVEGGEIRFKRTFHAPPRKNHFCYIDDAKVSLKEYVARVRDFSIQPENLTQFLPQDRVSGIVYMTAEDLLLSTEAALGADVCEMHHELIEHRKQWTPMEDKLKGMRVLAESQVTQKGQFESDIRKLRRVDKDKEMLMSTRLKLMILEWKASESALKTHSANLKALQEDPTSGGSLELRQKLKDDLETLFARLITPKSMSPACNISETLSSLRDSLKRDIASTGEIAIHRNELNSLMALSHDLDQQDEMVEYLSQDITHLETQITEMERSQMDDSSAQAAQDNLRAEIESLSTKSEELSAELRDAEATEQDIQERLRNLPSSLERLRKRLYDLVTAGTVSSDVLQVFDALQKLPKKYENRVIGPLFLYVFPRTETSAQYMESVFDLTLHSFLCDTLETQSQMKEEFLVGQKLVNLSTLVVPPGLYHQRQAAGFTVYDREAFTQLKFNRVLSELFDAPERAKIYLDRQFAAHTILIHDDGDQYTAESLTKYWQKVKKGSAERLMFCANGRLYEELARSGIVKASPLVQPCLLQYDPSAVNCVHTKARLETDLTAAKKQLLDRRESLKAATKQLSDRTEELRNLEEDAADAAVPTAAALKEALQRKKQQRSNAHAAERKPRPDSARLKDLKRDINSGNLRRRSFLISDKGVVDQMEKLSKAVHEVCRVGSDLTGDLLCTSRSFAALVKCKLNTNQIQEDIKQGTERTATLQNDIKESKRRIVQLIKELYVDRKKSVSDVQAIFKFLNGVKTQTALVQRLGALFRNLEYDSHDKVDFAKVERQKITLATEHDRQLRERKRLEFDLKIAQISQLSLLQQWLSKLKTEINRIGRDMTGMFRRMGYDGYVYLAEPEDASQYDKYGLEFLVKFREEDQLARLAPGRQSGGERGVVIAVFLLALQTCSDVPFRVVDELNQGMDPTNERYIFQLVLDASLTSDAQYISCSPKIPPCYEADDQGNLNFCFLMKTAPDEDPAKYSVTGFCDAYRRYLAAEAESDGEDDDLVSENGMSE